MYSQFIKELIDLPDVLIQKVRKEEEHWIFELSLPEQCPLCPVCLKRTIKMTGKKCFLQRKNTEFRNEKCRELQLDMEPLGA